ncbi:menaquinone biosynthetic enzyme MqnA/MqnD family protein [Paenibacillus sp. NPDC057967]|uniref:menaquinone biosynthetic enzyme MqnA/MqnD family protein n=1 Tax=Paenibacillus sp. NPDC057967 TaxID=3346293 RepID=UPI0036DF032E
MSNSHRITIGEIDYANAWPLFKGFERQVKGLDYEMIARVPSELNRLLSAGELDISAISSFSYGQYCDDYVLMPGLSVGSIGRVHSLLLFMKEPLEKRKPRKIAVTTTTATTINLLKIIMTMRFGIEPEYVRAEPDLKAMLKDSDAALLIGDPAITASWHTEGLHVLDLGELWHNWTGFGMAYAVVAARRSAVEKHGSELRAIYEAMLAVKAHNQHNTGPLIERACATIGGESSYWETYFRSLQYDFGDKLQAGLSLYFQYARELNLLQHEARLTFYEGHSPQKVKE